MILTKAKKTTVPIDNRTKNNATRPKLIIELPFYVKVKKLETKKMKS